MPCVTGAFPAYPLDEECKTEMPPVDEPLEMNLELMRAISREGTLPRDTFAYAEEIIREGGELFLNRGLDSRYSFAEDASDEGFSSDGVEFDHATLRVPVVYATPSTKICVAVTSADDAAVTFEDWHLESVERGTEGDITSFRAAYKSEAAADFKFSEGMGVDMTIQPWPEMEIPEVSASLKAIQSKSMPWDYAAVWDDGIRFVTA